MKRVNLSYSWVDGDSVCWVQNWRVSISEWRYLASLYDWATICWPCKSENPLKSHTLPQPRCDGFDAAFAAWRRAHLHAPTRALTNLAISSYCSGDSIAYTSENGIGYFPSIHELASKRHNQRVVSRSHVSHPRCSLSKLSLIATAIT